MLVRSKRLKVLLFLATASLLFGCVDSPGGVVILQNTVPSAGCVVDSSSTSYVTLGAMDVMDRGQLCFIDDPPSYTLYLQVKNEMPATGDSEAGLGEQNYIQINEAQIDLNLGALGGGLESSFTSFRFPSFRTIAPGETAGLEVLAIPPQTAARLAVPAGEEVIVRAEVRFVFRHGGLDKKTHSIEFPIRVCNGCVFQNSGNCADPTTLPANPNEGHPCNPAQDVPIDCCTSSGGCLICPAQAPTTP